MGTRPEAGDRACRRCVVRLRGLSKPKGAEILGLFLMIAILFGTSPLSVAQTNVLSESRPIATGERAQFYQSTLPERQITEMRGDSGPSPRTRELCGQECTLKAALQIQGQKAAYLQEKIEGTRLRSQIPQGFCETTPTAETDAHCIARFKALLVVELIRVRGQMVLITDKLDQLITYRNSAGGGTGGVVERNDVAMPDGRAYPEESATGGTTANQNAHQDPVRRQRAIVMTLSGPQGGGFAPVAPQNSPPSGHELQSGFLVLERTSASSPDDPSVGRVHRDPTPGSGGLGPAERQRLQKARVLEGRARGHSTSNSHSMSTPQDEQYFENVVKHTRVLQANKAARSPGEIAEEVPVYSSPGFRAAGSGRVPAGGAGHGGTQGGSEGLRLDDYIDRTVDQQLESLRN